MLAGVVFTLPAALSPLSSSGAELPPGILWSADHESGSLFAEWQQVWISGQADATIRLSESDPRNFSVALTISNADGRSPEPGVRLAKVATPHTPTSLPTSAYYSVWYYFPEVVSAPQWWNVLQWKRAWQVGRIRGSDPVYTINIGNRPDGAMYFYLYTHVGDDGGYNTAGVGPIALAPVNITLNRWTHLECGYVWSFDWTGTVRCWQDGAEIWNLTGLKTEFSEQKYLDHATYPRQWTVNNYASQTVPETHTLYVDNAAISTTPVGQAATPTRSLAPVETGTGRMTPSPPMDVDQDDAATENPTPYPPPDTGR